MKNKLIVNLVVILFIFMSVGTCRSEDLRSVYAGGTVYIPESLSPELVPVLIVRLVWESGESSRGGAERRIEEEARFTGTKGVKEIKFARVRLTPSSPDGNVSIDVACEMKKGGDVVSRLVAEKGLPEPMICEKALGGGFLDLKLKLGLPGGTEK